MAHAGSHPVMGANVRADPGMYIIIQFCHILRSIISIWIVSLVYPAVCPCCQEKRKLYYCCWAVHRGRLLGRQVQGWNSASHKKGTKVKVPLASREEVPFISRLRLIRDLVRTLSCPCYLHPLCWR
ncbi:hypothetical protein BJX64DRAFT_139535 [Aspergillus heterothallicus]